MGVGSADAVALTVTSVATPDVRARGARTRGRLPQVAGRARLARVNAALRRALERDERRFARDNRWYEARYTTSHYGGTYETLPTALVSASSRVVSALVPVTACYPGGTDCEGWTSATVRVPSARRVRLRDLFRDPHAGLAALQRSALARLNSADECATDARDFVRDYPGEPDFALLPSGLAVGWTDFPACAGRFMAAVPYSKLSSRFSPSGRRLIAGVRSPANAAALAQTQLAVDAYSAGPPMRPLLVRLR